MECGVEYGGDEFCNLADWVGSSIEFVEEVWVEGVDTVLENSFNDLHAFIDGLLLLADWSDCVDDLLWVCVSCKLDSLWLSAIVIILLDHWHGFVDELFELVEHVSEFLSDWLDLSVVVHDFFVHWPVHLR